MTAGPGPGGQVPRAPAEVLGSDTPRLSDRWTDLPRRGRLSVLVTTVLCLLASLLGYALANRPQPPPPPLAPWPRQVTSLTYLGALSPPDPATRSFTFSFRIAVQDGPPVTVRHLRPSFGLPAKTDPPLPFQVRARNDRTISVQIVLRTCSGLPLNASTPYIDLTVRNTRAIQNHSYIFEGAYARDLSQFLHRLCDPSRARGR
jgi:hypothetical protein